MVSGLIGSWIKGLLGFRELGLEFGGGTSNCIPGLLGNLGSEEHKLQPGTVSMRFVEESATPPAPCKPQAPKTLNPTTSSYFGGCRGICCRHTLPLQINGYPSCTCCVTA